MCASSSRRRTPRSATCTPSTWVPMRSTRLGGASTRRCGPCTTPASSARCHGRDDDAWRNTSGAAAERFRYDYSDAELTELAKPMAELTGEARETHLLMNNCYRDFAVRNAWTLRELLAERSAP